MFILKGIKNFLSDLYHNRIAILCIIIYMSVTQYLFHSVCPIAILFGFPCPACGLTRAGISFLTAHFSTAFQMNPCIFLLIPYFLYLWFYKYIFEKKAALSDVHHLSARYHCLWHLYFTPAHTYAP
ncbi:MAG: DUF2752 domain-containing protein [Roseburia inulinivorans]